MYLFNGHTFTFLSLGAIAYANFNTVCPSRHENSVPVDETTYQFHCGMTYSTQGVDSNNFAASSASSADACARACTQHTQFHCHAASWDADSNGCWMYANAGVPTMAGPEHARIVTMIRREETGPNPCPGQLEQCQAELEESSEQLSASQDTINGLEEDLGIAQNSISTLQNELNALRESYQELVGAQSACENALSDCNSRSQACSTDLSGCNTNLNTCNSQRQTCTTGLSTCNTNLNTCNSQRQTCTTGLSTCNTNLNTCNSQRQTCTTGLSTCNTNLNTCNSQRQTSSFNCHSSGMSSRCRNCLNSMGYSVRKRR